MVPQSSRFASSFLAIGRCCGPDSVVRKFSRKLGFCLPKLPRKRFPLPGFDACGRIIFGLLSHVTTDDKHASVMRNVSLPTLAPLLRTLPLQEMPRHLHVWLAEGLYNKVFVLIGLGDKTPSDVDLCALRHVPTTCVHDLAGRLVCQKCKKAGKRPAATLLQLAPRSRQPPPEN